MFRKESLPHVAMNPQDANSAFIRGDVELVRISEAGGRIAAEGHCHTRRAYCARCRGDLGRRGAALFFWRWKRASICCPVFAGIAGVYSETDADGIKRLYGYVLK